MLLFESDYTEGAHDEVLRRLCETNLEPLTGYGNDHYCDAAKTKIRTACGCPDADVFFLTGGTQTNQVVIESLLDTFEGVVCCNTGHIGSHEAGAIEYTGHKVLPLPQQDGKLIAATLEAYLQTFYADENRDHTVFPGMVYISHPTEYGTLYSLAELTALHAVCSAYSLPLYVDGARLAYALASSETDVTLRDLADLCDVFYIGGTKCGTLCGEAVVFSRRKAPRQFFTRIKQHGALLAKGRLLGVQFDALFSNDLYSRIGHHAIEAANKLRAALCEKGYPFFIQTSTNQIFIVLTNEQLAALKDHVSFSFWERQDETHVVVRIATSWATREADVQALIALL